MSETDYGETMQRVLERLGAMTREVEKDRLRPDGWNKLYESTSITYALREGRNWSEGPYFSRTTGTVEDPDEEGPHNHLDQDLSSGMVERISPLSREEESILGEDGVVEVAKRFLWSRGFTRPRPPDLEHWSL